MFSYFYSVSQEPEGNQEIKWFVTPENEVLVEDPEQPVPNHLALLMQHKGRDYVNQFMTGGAPVPIGLQGTVQGDRLNVGGYLMSDMSSPGRSFDPSKSWAGHVKVRNAVNRVKDELAARGIDVGEQYDIPTINPGEGVGTRPRNFSPTGKASSLQGSFFDQLTGEEIAFKEIERIPGDKITGVEESWELQGEDGNKYFLTSEGAIHDELGNLVGGFDPYAYVPLKIEAADWSDVENFFSNPSKESAKCPQCGTALQLVDDPLAGSYYFCPNCKKAVTSSFEKEAASFEYKLAPHGLHFRTHAAMSGSGLSATVHYPPGITQAHPEGFTSTIPGPTGFQDMLITADYPSENNGQSVEGVPVIVDTENDPTHVAAIFDALGGREISDETFNALPENVRNTISSMTRRANMNEKVADQIADLYTDQEKKALTCPKCGSHTLRAFDATKDGKASIKCLTCGNVFSRPVFKNPEASVKEGVGQGPQYPIDPATQSQIIGLMQQISEATDPQVKQQLQQQLEQLLGGNPNQDAMQQAPASPNTIPSAPAPPSTQQYQQYASLEEPPEWFIERLNEELMISLGAMDKGSPYPSDSYKNAPDHTPKGQKKWPSEVNAVYNACMREGHGSGDSKEERESSCAKIAWAQYKKTQDKDSHTAAEGEKGKHSPGTRVQMLHPKFKGQRGSVLDYNGKHKDLDEEQYNVLLDNGEKVDCMESHFKRIKSASRRIVDNSNLVVSTDNHFIGSMTFEAESGEFDPDPGYSGNPEHEDFSDFGDDEETVCPMCGGPGVPLGQLGSKHWFRCRNCGLDFSQDNHDELDLTPGSELAELNEMDAKYPGWDSQAKIADDSGWPKADLPKNPNGLPEAPKFDGNKTKFPYDPPAQDSPYEEPDLAGGDQDTECPNCHSNAKSKGEFGARAYYECSSCGMEFAYPNSDESAKWAPDDPDKLFGQEKPEYNSSTKESDVGTCPVCNKPSVVDGVCTNCGWQDPSRVQTPVDVTESAGRISATDTAGLALREGYWYILHGAGYKVPDVIKIIKMDDDQITAHFETDKDGQYPLQIASSDFSKFRFDPYERSEDPLEVDLHAQKSASGWQTTARRSFSPKEQKDLIEENLDGRARNYDKLDLAGTHYETRVNYALADGDFLWGI